MRKLELLVIVGAAATSIVRAMARQADPGRLRSARLQVSLGLVSGLLASVVVLSDRVDFVPDPLERPLAIATMAVAAVTWVILSRRRREQRAPYR